MQSIFRRILALRVPILIAAAVLVPVAAFLSFRIPSEGAIGRLMVPTDPDYVATREFQAVFPEGQVVILLLEADNPFAPATLTDLTKLEGALRRIKGVSITSVLDVYTRAHPGFAPARGAETFRRFATGTQFFRRQGLVGDHFLGVVTAFSTPDPKARDAVLAQIDAAVDATRFEAVTRVRRVGAPYIESWIEHQAGQASSRYFPLFGIFVVAVSIFLYRSWRSVLAILLALGTGVALAVGAGDLLGFSFTVVSSLVPLTVMVTTLASLVYIHSRFVDQPEGVSVEDHQLFALANKFLPVTASTVAAVLGFSALAVSKIRPIREMGIWTAVGLALGWIVVFTVFPALQRVLRTPTGRTVAVRSKLYDHLVEHLPEWSFRWRWPLLVGCLALACAGLVALLGIPGRLAPMKIGVDALDYVDPKLPIAQDMRFFRDHVSGLNAVRVWVRTPPGEATNPEILRGLDRFTSAVEALPQVNAAVGPTTFLRLRRYLSGQGDTLPQDPQAFATLTADVEQLLLSEPELRGFIDVGTLSNAQVTVTFRGQGEEDYQALSRALQEAWDRTVAKDPAFRGVQMRVVGESLLQAKVAGSLVPTLSESFIITAVLIFLAFLFVFRSFSARLMAMIPSVFAILVTFLGMRLFGASLNVATTLIATTVLGTTENDQIHFFHHLQEKDAKGKLVEALRYTFHVSGRAIIFATLINAAGFLALSFSTFPPLRQFGIITASAFLLAMIADFTALPGALWIVRRERPDARPQGSQDRT